MSAKPRYHGNITIEMIDDFLNPFSKKKETVSKVKFAPPPVTDGQGLVDTKPNARYNKTRENNFDYVTNNRRHYEKELKETNEALSVSHMQGSHYAESSVCFAYMLENLILLSTGHS